MIITMLLFGSNFVNFTNGHHLPGNRALYLLTEGWKASHKSDALLTEVSAQPVVEVDLQLL